MADTIAGHIRHNFIEQLEQLKTAGVLTRQDQARKLASSLDAIMDKEGGMALIYDHIGDIVEAGFFDDTQWKDPDVLNYSLVGGTLKAGGMNTVYEVLSELRILAIARGRLESPAMTAEAARRFLEELVVVNLDLLFPDASEELRNVDEATRRKIENLFAWLKHDFIQWDRISRRLAKELEQICSQRPIVTDRAKSIIRTVREQMADQITTDRMTAGPGTKPSSEDDAEGRANGLPLYIDALYAPSPESVNRTPEEYEAHIANAPEQLLGEECDALSFTLRQTGLSSAFHALMLKRVSDMPELIGRLLGLNDYGLAELKEHHASITRFISFACRPDTTRFVYGLAAMLERNLLSRQPVMTGLEKLTDISLHPDVAAHISASRPDSRCTPLQHLFADTICMMGQPLGVGQGWNPTCQSARGMSLWSRHAPGKLLDLIHTAASSNDLEMRFEGQLLKASELPEGLAKDFDYNLDAVSIALVPHLDRIYFEMMRRASGRGEDPHKWVNPAMYGQWIHTGFRTPYNYLYNTISRYDAFLRLFYATHHPEYNGGHDLAYPNPVGIFLTAANGKLLGFHAVSLLRVARHEEDYRIYFLNPNNEGRQKWQSDIQPTVAGYGEQPGESSLPFYQFASRLYAFHYNPADSDASDRIPAEEIERVTKIAKNSWGASYTWQDVPEPIASPGIT
ncbi:hypothetical protein QA596_09065 [Balneolales bacterium ANBcel1]|nr:hypothetical protein [Balneolales bacterium ANBcel1]